MNSNPKSVVDADPKAIFLRALDYESHEERDKFLDRTCAEDRSLRMRVDVLLTAHAGAGRFLGGASSDVTSTETISEHAGTLIGPYKLLEQIGEGGFGVVFMAEQQSPIQRKVALKIIKPGMDTRQVIARFEAERQALALMDHPNIARVLDAGATDTGRPYFVMELVRGVPVTEYCDQHQLSVRARLGLFVTICQAVQHAHQKGIIHRDLKPTNVLVTQRDSHALVKVIDFGIAKATGQKLTDKTLFTGFAQLIGTPLYMSPEQAEMSEPDVDTRSDIYSLGVLLYELLTGSTPFDSQRLKAAPFDELRRIIREEEPPRPSTRFSTLAQREMSTISERRSTDARHLSRLFHGELDWIVMKSLEKDRTRRYETASDLAADVERYLNDEPVKACPPSALYRSRKFARKHRVALVTATLVICALLLGTGISVWQAVRATRAERQAITNEQQAVENARRADAVSGFLVEAFRSPDPINDGRSVTIVEVLDRAAKSVRQRFADDPLTQADLLEAIGSSYQGLGLYREAIPVLEQARDLCIKVLTSESPGTLRLMNRLSQVYLADGRINDALAQAELTRELCQNGLKSTDSENLQSMVNLASALQNAGHLDRAVTLFKEAFETAEMMPEHPDLLELKSLFGQSLVASGKVANGLPLLKGVLELRTTQLGPEDPRTITDKFNLAKAYVQAGRRAEGLGMLEEVLSLRKSKLSPTHPDTLTSMENLAVAYYGAGRTDEALPLFEAALAGRKDKLSPNHPETLLAMHRVAKFYALHGRVKEAIELMEEALPLERTRVEPQHPHLLQLITDLAAAYAAADRPSDAIPLYAEWLRVAKAQGGAENSKTIDVMNDLAEVYLAADQPVDAEPLIRECLAIFEKTRPDDWDTFFTRMSLGTALFEQKKYDAAEPLLRSGYEGMLQRIDKIPEGNRWFLKEAMGRLVLLYEATDQPEKVAQWKQKLNDFDNIHAEQKSDEKASANTPSVP